MPGQRRSEVPRYDGIASWHDEFFSSYGDLSDPLSSSSHLARLLGPGSGRCLDIACGGGLHHAAITSTGRTVVGVDISRDQLRVEPLQQPGKDVEWHYYEGGRHVLFVDPVNEDDATRRTIDFLTRRLMAGA